MPRKPASLASGARMAERRPMPSERRAGMPAVSVRRRGVGNPERTTKAERAEGRDARSERPAAGRG